METGWAHKAAERILATPAPRPWWNQHYTWSADDEEKLKVLAAAEADLNRSALALGRSAAALVWHARKLSITLPPEWAKRIQKVGRKK